MPPLRGSVDVLVNIKGNNRDALAAIGGTRAALSGLALGQRRQTIETRAQQREAVFLNRALAEQHKHFQALSLDYVASRKALLSLTVRGAVSGFNALASAVDAAGQGFASLVGSAGEAMVALGAVGAQGALSALQGIGVLALGLKGLNKVILSS